MLLITLFFTLTTIFAFCFGWICADIDRTGREIAEDIENQRDGE